MKIFLKNEPVQVALIKAMASKNKVAAYEAQVALAEFVGPVLAEVINNAPTVSNLFTKLTFSQEDSASIPLDAYSDIFDLDYLKVWTQSVAGGLPTNVVQPTSSELKLATYNLSSAFSFDKKWAAKSRLDVVSKTFTRMAQEILGKQEATSANMICTALASASTGTSSTAAENLHVFRTATANRLIPNDFNKLFTKIKRINSSFLGGTPVGSRQSLTDLLISPEVMEDLRGMAYNPINTAKSPVIAPTTSYTASNAPITAPDSIREQLFNQSGMASFMNVNLMELNELGIGRRFNTVFDVAAGSTTFSDHYSIAASVTSFTGADEEICIGLDRSRESLIVMTETDSETGGTFSLQADDSFWSQRQGKVGFYGSLIEGRVILDSRSLVGLVV